MQSSVDPHGANDLGVLLDNGWRDARMDPPDNDRSVQIAWSDGSFDENSTGAYDSFSGEEEKGKKWWVPWCGGGWAVTEGVIAWREWPSATGR